MATAAPNQGLPLFYNSIEPLNLEQHGKMKVRAINSVPEIGRTHAVPLTVDEFTLVQRHYPIVFSVGGSPVPIALMGLNDGVNVFLDENGRAIDQNIYIPAYLRRYGPTATSCRCAMIPHRARSASSTKAKRCSMATSRARRPRPFCSSASSSRRPAFAPTHSWKSL